MASPDQRRSFDRLAAAEPSVPIPPFPAVPEFLKSRSPMHREAYEQWEAEIEKWRRNLGAIGQKP